MRATPSPIIIMTSATTRKITGRLTQVGGPLALTEVKNSSCPPPRFTWTGNTSTNRISRASATGAHRNRSTRDLARRKPRPMPRKLPSRTKFEKYDR